MKPEQLKSDEAEFAAAFSEDTPKKGEQTEDEAFGLSAPAEPQSGPSGEKPAGLTPPVAAAAAEVDPAADSDAPTDAVTDVPAAEPSAEGASEAATDSGTVDLTKETQRLKSWEGRLKAEEKRLREAAQKSGKSEESVASDAIEKVADSTNDPELAAQAENLAEQVEEGAISAADAMKQLSEDFGEDFVKAIMTAAKEAAREAVKGELGELKKTTDDIVGHIRDSATREHFKAIAAAHKDFKEIGESEEFKAYVAALPDPDRGDAERILKGGNAEEVISLLSGYKTNTGKVENKPEAEAAAPAAAKTAEDAVSDDDLDAAEGVRSSGGMALPSEPAASNDFAAAWNEA
jgi:hypothetical protein